MRERERERERDRDRDRDRESLSTRGASAIGPFGMMKTSHNRTTVDSVAGENFTEHRNLLISLGRRPSYRTTNVTKHTAARAYPPQSGVAFLGWELSSVAKET